eukprot:39350-Eustigmatos_ZCMA.PRE.1
MAGLALSSYVMLTGSASMLIMLVLWALYMVSTPVIVTALVASMTCSTVGSNSVCSCSTT